MTAELVLDASIVLAWCFEDEASPYADRVLDALRTSRAVAPSVWPLEVGNALVVAERRGRLKPADTERFLGLVRTLPIEVRADPTDRVLTALPALARDHRLSVYDASYLDLAAREGLPLATLDEALQRAAGVVGLPTWGAG